MSGKSLAVEMLRSALSENKHVIFSATGHSMLPLIFPGEEIVLGKSASGHYARGDILLFQTGGRLTLHRLHRLLDTSDATGHPLLLTKGDASPQFDAPLSLSNVIGRVTACRGSFLRKGRWIFFNFLQIYGFIMPSFFIHRLRKTAWYGALFKLKKACFGLSSRINQLSAAFILLFTLVARLFLFSQRFCAFARFRMLLPGCKIRSVAFSNNIALFFSCWCDCQLFPHFLGLSAFEKYIATHVASADCLAIIAELNGKPIGFMLAARSCNQTKISLEAVAVSAPFRRKGVATALFHKLRKYCKQSNIGTILCCQNNIFFPALCLDKHDSAIHLLYQLGFKSDLYQAEMTLQLTPEKIRSLENNAAELSARHALDFVWLSKSNCSSLLTFLKQELPDRLSFFLRLIERLHSSNLGEGALMAYKNGAVIAVCYYGNALAGLGMSSSFRVESRSAHSAAGDEPLYTLSHFCVKRGLRGSGTGTALCSKILVHIASINRHATVRCNTPTPIFYERDCLGFTRLGTYVSPAYHLQ